MSAHQIQFFLARRPRLVAVARHRVSAHVTAWGQPLDPDTKDALDMLVSELVTNAVLHATGLLISVAVRLDGHRLRVEVNDDSPVPLTWQPDGSLSRWDDENGRGLQMVAVLATRHGWRPTLVGKQVWFELDLPRPARVRASAQLLRVAARAARRTVTWPIPARSTWTAPVRPVVA